MRTQTHQREPFSSTTAAPPSTKTRVLWNALRHMAGLLMGAIGLLFFLGFAFELMEPQTDLPRWTSVLLMITLGFFPLLCAVALLKKSVFNMRHHPCPACA